MAKQVYIFLLFIVGFLAGCQRAELPEPMNTTPDESTFFVDFEQDGADNSIVIGFEDFVMVPDYENLENLLHYKAIFKKSQECGNDCHEQLVITMIDESEYDEGSYNPQDAIFSSERLYVEPSVSEEILNVYALVQTNYSEPLFPTTQIENFEDNPLISYGEITSIFEPDFWSSILNINSIFQSEDENWSCTSGALLFDPTMASSMPDFEIQTHYPDSNKVTLTATEASGSQIDNGEFLVDTSSYMDWSDPLIIELDHQNRDKTINYTMDNAYNINFGQIKLSLNPYSGEIQYSIARNNHELVSQPIISNISSKVIIEYTDPSGTYYSSALSDQNTQYAFNIISVEDFSPYHNGQNTLKLEVAFSVRLENDLGETLELTDAKGTIAVAYPD